MCVMLDIKNEVCNVAKLFLFPVNLPFLPVAFACKTR